MVKQRVVDDEWGVGHHRNRRGHARFGWQNVNVDANDDDGAAQDTALDIAELTAIDGAAAGRNGAHDESGGCERRPAHASGRSCERCGGIVLDPEREAATAIIDEDRHRPAVPGVKADAREANDDHALSVPTRRAPHLIRRALMRRVRLVVVDVLAKTVVLALRRRMGLIDRLLNRAPNSTTPTTATTSTQATTPAKPASPLEPAFAMASAPQQAQIKNAKRASQFLGENFKAALMEVGVANVSARPQFHYGTGKPQSMSLNKTLPDKRLDLVICMNVSGHDLKERADKDQALATRAKDNRYVIQVTYPDGTKQRMSGIAANGALSTSQAISIRDMKPGLTVVEAWPEGSAGVGGYIEGRRLEINYRPPGNVDSFG